MTEPVDAIVIGAGIAGASLAAELAPTLKVLVLEAEDMPGRHATGRSAAFLSETYGGPMIQPLTTASRAFLEAPPADVADGSFLGPRGALHIAAPGKEALLETFAASFPPSVELEPCDRPALLRRVPGLRDGWDRGLWEPSCSDIDVARLHAHYLARARRSGARLVMDAEMIEARQDGGSWVVTTRSATFRGLILVNAAGAWADQVAHRAGQRPVGIQPYRRTVAQLRLDPPTSQRLPLVIDIAGGFYFKPETGGRLWLSPHDETPSDPCDCAAEELDVALAIDRMQSAVDWSVERVERQWAGLRSFAPDRLPVYGYAPGARNFFWFAGQGGFGIQTAPAAARIAASLILGRPADPTVRHIDPADFLPDRLMA